MGELRGAEIPVRREVPGPELSAHEPQGAAVDEDRMEAGSSADVGEGEGTAVDVADMEVLVRQQMIAAGIDPESGLPIGEKLTCF